MVRITGAFIVLMFGETLWATCGTCCTNTCCNKDYAYNMTHFSQRPQGNNQVWTLMGIVDKIHRLENEENYVLADLTIGYRNNFDSFQLSKYFFTEYGPLVVGPLNTSVDVQNLQLGLAHNFQGNAVLNPHINEAVADIDFFLCPDNWVQGIWARVRFPFIYSAWSSCLQSYTSESGASNYPDGFAAPSGTLVSVEYRGINAALNDSTGFGQIPALTAGRICPYQQSRWGLSDIHLELGYDFYRCQRGNVGVALIGAVPTGTPSASSCNRYLFEPMIGSQRSGQVGVLLRGQYELFNLDNNKIISLYGDLRLIHLLQGCTRRLFSLNVGNTTAFNYWLLLNRYDNQGEFLGVERAANILNQKVNVSADMLEFSAIIQMRKGNIDLSGGYNFWMRSQECVCPQNLTFGNGSDYYAIKDTDTTAEWATEIADKNCTNVAYHCGSEIDADAAHVDNIRRYSLQSGNIAICTAQHPRTYSSTFFGYAGYNFVDHCSTPHLGIGITAEFGCGNTALSMLGLFVKGNISF